MEVWNFYNLGHLYLGILVCYFTLLENFLWGKFSIFTRIMEVWMCVINICKECTLLIPIPLKNHYHEIGSFEDGNLRGVPISIELFLRDVVGVYKFSNL